MVVVVIVGVVVMVAVIVVVYVGVTGVEVNVLVEVGVEEANNPLNALSGLPVPRTEVINITAPIQTNNTANPPIKNGNIC